MGLLFNYRGGTQNGSKRKKKWKLTFKYYDGRPYISGSDTYRLMTTLGLPLWLINEQLRVINGFFEVKGFVEECLKNDWEPERIKTVLIDSTDIDIKNEVVKLVDALTLGN